MKIVMVVTAALTARTFVLGFAEFVSARGHAVTIISDQADTVKRDRPGSPISFVTVPMDRQPHPKEDLASLIKLVRAVKREEPDVLLYATPKASLLASIAGFLVRVRTRIYQLWGLRLETTKGGRRRILAIAEHVTSLLSHKIIANSQSLANRYNGLSLSGKNPATTIGRGSSHGVDTEFFKRSARIPDLDDQTQKFLERKRDLLIGYVGRLHPDKGIDTLIRAGAECVRQGLRIDILLIGRDEGVDVDALAAESSLIRNILLVGEVEDVRPYYAAMDVLVLMSRREGFPNVILEAAAMETPAIVSDATGAIDSVDDGHSGFVVPVADASKLAERLICLARDRSLIDRLGRGARDLVEKEYRQEDVWAKYLTAIVTTNNA